MTAIIIIVILTFCVGYAIFSINKDVEKERTRDGYSLDFRAQLYEKCLKEGISDAQSTFNQRKIVGVAKTMKQFQGYSSITTELAARLYNIGKKIYKKEQAKKAYYENIKIYSKQKEEAELIGTDKYLKYAKEDLAKYEYEPRYISPPQKSVKGAALKGSIFGGTAYGIASAQKAQRDNELAKENAEASYRVAKGVKDSLLRFLHYHISEQQLREHIASIESLPWDDSDAKTWFSALKFFNISCTVTRNNAIKVTGRWEINKQFALLGKSAFLDGSLRIKILDQANRFVGYAYCAAPGVGDWTTMQSGFAYRTSFEALYVPPKKKLLKSSQNFHCEIEAHHLWLMTKR